MADASEVASDIGGKIAGGSKAAATKVAAAKKPIIIVAAAAAVLVLAAIATFVATSSAGTHDVAASAPEDESPRVAYSDPVPEGTHVKTAEEAMAEFERDQERLVRESMEKLKSEQPYESFVDLLAEAYPDVGKSEIRKALPEDRYEGYLEIAAVTRLTRGEGESGKKYKEAMQRENQAIADAMERLSGKASYTVENWKYTFDKDERVWCVTFDIKNTGKMDIYDAPLNIDVNAVYTTYDKYDEANAKTNSYSVAMMSTGPGVVFEENVVPTATHSEALDMLMYRLQGVRTGDEDEHQKADELGKEVAARDGHVRVLHCNDLRVGEERRVSAKLLVCDEFYEMASSDWSHSNDEKSRYWGVGPKDEGKDSYVESIGFEQGTPVVMVTAKDPEVADEVGDTGGIQVDPNYPAPNLAHDALTVDVKKVEVREDHMSDEGDFDTTLALYFTLKNNTKLYFDDARAVLTLYPKGTKQGDPCAKMWEIEVTGKNMAPGGTSDNLDSYVELDGADIGGIKEGEHSLDELGLAVAVSRCRLSIDVDKEVSVGVLPSDWKRRSEQYKNLANMLNAMGDVFEKQLENLDRHLEQHPEDYPVVADMVLDGAIGFADAIV